jgi:enoyl reductase
VSRIVLYREHGGPEVLDIVEIPEPHAGPGQVRVAVKSAGVNPFDFKVRSDAGYLKTHALPSGQGSEFAGVVDEIGSDVTDVAVGDEVLGWTSFAAQADYVIVPQAHVAPKPAGLDWPLAGGIGAAGNAATRSAAAVSIGPGDTVLVSAAAGGVGLIAAQLAKSLGAFVIGTASPANHDFLRSLGIIPVAYGDGLLDRLREAAPEGISAVLDNHGQETVEAALDLGVSPARINTIVYYAGVERYGISAIGGGNKSTTELSHLAELFADGTLVLPIAATYPLEEVRAAYEQLESRHLRGKIVLVTA